MFAALKTFSHRGGVVYLLGELTRIDNTGGIGPFGVQTATGAATAKHTMHTNLIG